MRLGTTEIILIIVLALVLFGGGKLAGVGKALGRSIKDFKNVVKEKSVRPCFPICWRCARWLSFPPSR